MCFHRRFDYLQCPNCGCRMNAPDTSRHIYCRNCRTPLEALGFTKNTSCFNQSPLAQSTRRSRLWPFLFACFLALSLSGCDQATYDRGFKTGKKAGYKAGYRDGHRAGKIKGFGAGTASFVSGTFIPNLGLVIAITVLSTATSWLSVNYIIPQHRAKQAEYDAKNTVEKIREQLKQKTDVAVRSEIDRLQANLVIEEHEQSFQVELDELFATATLLLLNKSNSIVDQLCDLHLRTIREIAFASDLANEERTLLYPAAATQLSTISNRIISHA